MVRRLILSLSIWFLLQVFACFTSLVLAVRPSYAETSEIPDASSKRIVTDATDILTAAEEAQVAAECLSFSNHNNAEIVVYISDKLFAIDDKTFVDGLASSWKLGAGRSGRWVVLVFFTGNQQQRLACSEGLQGRLTRYMSFCIINAKIAPKFRQSKRAEGIRDGIRAIDSALAGKLEIPLKYKLVSIFGSGRSRYINAFLILYTALFLTYLMVKIRKRLAEIRYRRLLASARASGGGDAGVSGGGSGGGGGGGASGGW